MFTMLYPLFVEALKPSGLPRRTCRLPAAAVLGVPPPLGAFEVHGKPRPPIFVVHSHSFERFNQLNPTFLNFSYFYLSIVNVLGLDCCAS